MIEVSRTAAQQRADQIRAFRQELGLLAEAGVLRLADRQGQAVAEYHDGLLLEYAQAFDIDRDLHAKQLSTGMRIASFLGALALAASVFFLFYQFWGHFSEFAQVVILVSASLGAFVMTVLVQRRDSTGYFTKLAALVAFTCFVLNVTMLGQIFNITPADTALLPWAAYALLLAYMCDLRLLLATAILCIIAYVAARVGTWSGMYWINFGERPENFIPLSIAIYALPQLIRHPRHADFPAIYRVFGMLSLLLPILILANWGQASYLPWATAKIEGLYQMLGFLVSAAAIWLGLRRQWADSVNTGVVFFVIFIYTKFFDWWWDVMPKYLFFLVLGLTAVLFLVVLKRLRQTSDGSAT